MPHRDPVHRGDPKWRDRKLLVASQPSNRAIEHSTSIGFHGQLQRVGLLPSGKAGLQIDASQAVPMEIAQTRPLDELQDRLLLALPAEAKCTADGMAT